MSIGVRTDDDRKDYQKVVDKFDEFYKVRRNNTQEGQIQ